MHKISANGQNPTEIVLVSELPEDLKSKPVRSAWTRPWSEKLEPENTGIGAMAFARDIYGQTGTVVYFDEAVAGAIHTVLKHKEVYNIGVRSYCEKQRERVLEIVFSDIGRQMFLNAEKLDLFRQPFLDPERFNARKIGSGSEGDVYIYRIDGKDYAVKLYSAETQRQMNESARIWRMSFREPNFSRRIGFSRAVVAVVQDFPKHRFSLSTIVEYAASPSYIMMDLGPTLTVRDIFAAAGLEKTRDAISEDAKEFLSRHHISPEKLRQLQEELIALDDACTLMKFFKIGFLGSACGNHDLDGGNILVRAFDESSERFDLLLIDQGQDPLGHISPLYPVEWEELNPMRECYDRLNAVAEYRQYLDKYAIRRPQAKDVDMPEMYDK